MQHLDHGSASTSGASSPDIGSSRGKTGDPSAIKPKARSRKKVAKACLTCQKSHLTCDEKRPCTRCVKKGIGDQCVEGVRKKAKYLLEGEERHASRPHPTHVSPAKTTKAALASDPSTFDPRQTHLAAQTPTAPANSLLPDIPYDPPLTASTSQHVPEDVWLAGPLNDSDAVDNKWSDPFAGTAFNDTNVPSSSIYLTAAADEFQMLDAMFGGLSPITLPDNFNPIPPSDALLLDPTSLGCSTDGHVGLWENKPFISPSSSNPLQAKSFTNAAQTGDIGYLGLKAWSEAIGNGIKLDIDGGGPFLEPPQRNTRSLTPGEVYRKILKPYDYTEGYHILMDYLTKNFDRKDILRVVHALASFRPSLIALQMPMSEDDEVFIERSFQRTMIELEKLISYSATPTAVWRRTGEICYANPEFCALSGRNDAELYGKKNYIYHLFEKSSVISYWENFSVHAFENTTQNFFQPTTLSVNGVSVPCSCCFTIRRDVFDLPSVVIGQFLRIPGDI
ncbi:hypothetical protein BD324DRAFT_295567 [Kockovaella imperatae]|uniref:Transcription activator of gluconeogenesis ERT1 n=1 Tax=Kockovaella imperatae TaxID=4999 RepID=A0A1Y1ULF5_9TREE|nr:hypothetical protein BD324DRAFT_295567 [Kockovaella imperatae]ORX38878.1 hypothetical protein BD324DRAFT_295567 [Kockovaella imperatae]